MKEIQDLIKSGATIVDVRSREEFEQGHVTSSVNIPLNEVVARIDEFKSIEQPFLVCCLSGERSEQATEYLQSMDIKCLNAGGWQQVKSLLSD
jgi:rhodanese-related sulfurtransferase